MSSRLPASTESEFESRWDIAKQLFTLFTHNEFVFRPLLPVSLSPASATAVTLQLGYSVHRPCVVKFDAPAGTVGTAGAKTIIISRSFVHRATDAELRLVLRHGMLHAVVGSMRHDDAFRKIAESAGDTYSRQCPSFLTQRPQFVITCTNADCKYSRSLERLPCKAEPDPKSDSALLLPSASCAACKSVGTLRVEQEPYYAKRGVDPPKGSGVKEAREKMKEKKSKWKQQSLSALFVSKR